MAGSQMLLKCSKTGRLFFSQEEASEHAEAFGAAYANFEEVSVDAKVWVCVENGRPAYTEQQMEKLKRTDPDCKTFEEKTVAYLLDLQKQKAAANARKDRFFDSVNQKKLTTMVEAKSIGRTRAAKALHFTRDQGTIEAAEVWIEEHKDDASLDKLPEEFLESIKDELGLPEAEAAPEPEEPDTRQPGDPNPEEIKEAVNKNFLKELMDMGFAELRAEKALYLTDSASLEHAANWLTDHSEDKDIDLPLKKPRAAPEAKAKLSKEEAAQKAKELQQRLREKKAQEEKLSEKEKERMRVESTKMMQEANEKLKEEERKRWIEQQKREKEESERDRLKLKEQLRLDYIDRFGKEPPREEDEKEKTIKDKTAKERMIFYLNQLKKRHKETNPEGLKTCLNTMKIYCKNLKDNPQEEKFKTLKLENKAFQTRVAPIEGCMDFLDVMGFEHKGDCLVQRKSVPDGFLCGEACKFIDLMVGQL